MPRRRQLLEGPFPALWRMPPPQHIPPSPFLPSWSHRKLRGEHKTKPGLENFLALFLGRAELPRGPGAELGPGGAALRQAGV